MAKALRSAGKLIPSGAYVVFESTLISGAIPSSSALVAIEILETLANTGSEII